MTPEGPKYIVKQIHLQTAVWDLLKVDRIPAILEKHDVDGYDVCALVPSGPALHAVYRRINK